MGLKFSRVYYDNLAGWKDDKIRYIVNCGGTGSTKTYSILELLLIIALKYPVDIDIVGYSVPHLKLGVLKDLPNICADAGIDWDARYKKADKVFRGKGRINFISFDKLGKSLGGRRDILYINEGNNIPWKIVQQLIIRTRKKVFTDFNPADEFWAYSEIRDQEPQKTKWIHSTYLDNPWLGDAVRESLEARRGDGNNNFWRVYGRGELGRAEGLIFDNFRVEDFDFNRFDSYRNGIDWGYSNDPFAFIRVALEQNRIYICREIYQRGLLNTDSAPMVKSIIGRESVNCDSAEPKSADEYKTLGVDARKAKKGPGSVEFGIKWLQGKEIIIHPSCAQFYREAKNYQWALDKLGNPLPRPIDAFNHGIDALRYALEDDMIKNTGYIGY
jgi:phage terminase large subunit